MARWRIEVIDSAISDQLLDNYDYTVVAYEPAWQGIRLSLSFKGYESVRRSIIICQTYIDKAPTSGERVRRLVRVKLLVTAIPVYDWRQDGESADLIQATMMQCNDAIDEVDRYIKWDWNDARTQAYYMYSNAHGMFQLMRRQLRNRRTRTRGPKTALHYFLAILDEVINAQVDP